MTHARVASDSKSNMRWHARATVGVLAAASLLAGCRSAPPARAAEEAPAQIEHIDGSELSRVTLSERAMERLALETGQISERPTSRSASPRLTVPYGALLYDNQGRTWIYTSPQPRTFVRAEVVVDYIEGDMAVLMDGPPAGTVVATVAVAELYGTEFTVGH